MRVVVVGAGFGGLEVARGLGGVPGVEITVVDRRNYHLFQPLLYQVATAGLSPAEISAPIRRVLAPYRNVRVRKDRMGSLDLEARTLRTDRTDLPWDRLVLACGARGTYFGNDAWEPFAPGLKSVADALDIRHRVLSAFEEAEVCEDPVRRDALLTFVVVGGGPTGVEIAGALGEMSRRTLVRDFRGISPEQARILLLEAGPRLLPSFEPSLGERSRHDLADLGVEVRTGAPVTAIDADGIEAGGDRIAAATKIWAAGVRGPSINETLGGELDRQGRIPVAADLSLPGHPDVFVLGDQARFEQDGEALPGLAPVAIQQGRHVAANIRRDLRGEKRRDFRYRDKGQMATIGRSRAVAEYGALRISGLSAWLAWIFVHIWYLIGYERRLVVMIRWAWSWLTFGRGARLIVDRERD